jgi:hypothetical protein
LTSTKPRHLTFVYCVVALGFLFVSSISITLDSEKLIHFVKIK